MKTLAPCAVRGRGGVLAVLVATALWPAEARAQALPDSVRAEIERLGARVDSLTRELARLRAADQAEEAQDALAELRAAAQAAAGGPPPAPAAEQQEFVGRQRSLQALNPEISANADMFGRVDQNDGDENNFFAREFEVSLVSNLDPYSRAKVFLSKHQGGGEITPFPGAEEEEGSAIEVEEGYVEWVGLPAGVSLKLGKFQQQFGQLNRWHSHALPFQTRSLPHLAFVGEGALAQTGASLHWLLPVGGDAGTYEATVEVTRSENAALFGASHRPSVLGHVNAFWVLSPAADLDLGLSWVNGSYEDSTAVIDRNLLGAEVAFTWRPPARARYRGVTIRGGVMVLDGIVPGTPSDTADRALGFWGAVETRLGESWLVGARTDRAESPSNPDEAAWLVSPTITWWQSEYVRLRLEYDLLGRSTTTNDGQLLLQVTFAMGPHKHESY